MGFFTSEAKGKLLEKVAQKGEDLVTTLHGEKDDLALCERIKSWAANQTRDAEYSEDFNAYLQDGDVIGRLIASLRSSSPGNTLGFTEFVDNNANWFVEHFPQHGVHRPQIIAVLSGIYGQILAETTHIANPYSEHGKLQAVIATNQAENHRQHRELIEGQERLEQTAQEVLKILQNTSASRSLGDCTGIVAQFKEKIEHIEKEFQHQCQFSNALKHYTELLQSIAVEDIHSDAKFELLCTLYCNIAICHANLGEFNEAIASLKIIPADVVPKSAIYHYVYAAILVQYDKDDQFPFALQCVQTALDLQPEYPRAYLLKQHLCALLKQGSYENITKELDDYIATHEAAFSEDGYMGDYYEYRGLISIAFGDSKGAYEYFEKAFELGYDETISKFNMLSALYLQAVENVPQGKHLIVPGIDYKKLIAVRDGLQELLEAYKEQATPYAQTQGNVVKLYVRVCCALRVPHDLKPLASYLRFADDYETLRLLVLGSDENLPEDIVSRLDGDDRFFVHARQLFAGKQFAECRNEIVGKLAQPDYILPESIAHMLLQLCIELGEWPDYWKYRAFRVVEQIDENLIQELDACAYEANGELDRATGLINGIASTSEDYHLLGNALRFYHRHNCVAECERLYIRIQRLHNEQRIYIDDPDDFYQSAIAFLVNNKRAAVENFFDAIPTSQISPECLVRIDSTYYAAINDATRLFEALSRKSALNTEDKINQVICLRLMRRYEEGLALGIALANTTKDERSLVKIYWHISDLYLLNAQPDDSYIWAEKAHQLTIQYPYDQTHRAFMTRSLRTGHTEGMVAVSEYQKKHPYVVNYIKEFHVDPDKENVLETLAAQLGEFNPDASHYEEREAEIASQYKKTIIPINLILKHYYDDWHRVWAFALKNKLHLGMGNPELQQLEASWLGEDIIVDAQTLVLMSLFGCLPSLRIAKRIHISYATICALQNYYMMSLDTTLFNELMGWLASEQSIILEPDGIIDDTGEFSEAFSREFIAGCNVAIRLGAPFLCADSVMPIYQAAKCPIISPEIRFVSIPTVCSIYGKEQPAESAQMIYRLLAGGTFISFGSSTMLEIIRANNYKISKDTLDRFLICKSDYDMASFATVYLQTIRILKGENIAAAEELTELLLQNANQIWRRGTYVRGLVANHDDPDAALRSEAITRYVLLMLRGIQKIWKELPSSVAEIHRDLESQVHGKNPF